MSCSPPKTPEISIPPHWPPAPPQGDNTHLWVCASGLHLGRPVNVCVSMLLFVSKPTKNEGSMFCVLLRRYVFLPNKAASFADSSFVFISQVYGFCNVPNVGRIKLHDQTTHMYCIDCQTTSVVKQLSQHIQFHQSYKEPVSNVIWWDIIACTNVT